MFLSVFWVIVVYVAVVSVFKEQKNYQFLSGFYYMPSPHYTHALSLFLSLSLSLSHTHTHTYRQIQLHAALSEKDSIPATH